MKTSSFLFTVILGLTFSFTLNSCASKAQAVSPSQEERELRIKKDDMMKKMDEGTAAQNAE